jgi:negative regulator of sigma E activity
MSHKEQRLSSYLDNELDEVTAGIVRRQIEEDPRMAERFQSFAAIRKQLSTAVQGEEAARETVFRRLERHVPRHPSIWERKIKVPLPAVAAAAAVFLFVGVFVLFTLIPHSGTPQVAEVPDPPDVDLTVTVDQLDVQEMLDWLNQRDMLDQVTIELPDSPTFRLRGEPALIRASEIERIPEGRDGNG